MRNFSFDKRGVILSDFSDFYPKKNVAKADQHNGQWYITQ